VYFVNKSNTLLLRLMLSVRIINFILILLFT